MEIAYVRTLMSLARASVTGKLANVQTQEEGKMVAEMLGYIDRVGRQADQIEQIIIRSKELQDYEVRVIEASDEPEEVKTRRIEFFAKESETRIQELLEQLEESTKLVMDHLVSKSILLRMSIEINKDEGRTALDSDSTERKH